MEYKTVDQSVTFKASPHEIYEMLIDSRKHSEFTGAPAEISREIGGKFTAMGGGLSGVNLDLEPDRKIVQSWRANDWPEGHHSTVVFMLDEAGGETRLHLTHAGVPAESYDTINKGWHDYYWEPMKKALEN